MGISTFFSLVRISRVVVDLLCFVRFSAEFAPSSIRCLSLSRTLLNSFTFRYVEKWVIGEEGGKILHATGVKRGKTEAGWETQVSRVTGEKGGKIFLATGVKRGKTGPGRETLDSCATGKRAGKSYLNWCQARQWGLGLETLAKRRSVFYRRHRAHCC